jgi:tetratricopeptide (TPR) repeat protein
MSQTAVVSPNAPLLTQAFQHLQAGRLRECQDVCVQVLKRDSADGDAFYMLGMVSYQLGDHQRAVASLQQAVRHRPFQAGYFHALGLAFDRFGDLAAAHENQTKALAIQPAYAEALNALAIVQIKQGLLNDARAALDRALSVRPVYPEAHLNLAHVHRLSGNEPQAEEHLRKALDQNPNLAPALRQLGLQLQAQGNALEAAAMLQRYLAIVPNDAQIHNEFGLAQQHLGKLDEAVVAYRAAIQLNPTLAAAHSNLGFAQTEAGRYDEAEGAYREALRLDPNFVEARVNMGIMRRRRFDFAGSAEEQRAALAVMPGHANATLLLGDALYGLGEKEQAHALFAQSIARAADHASSHQTVATLLHQHGDSMAALDHLRQAIAFNPEHEQAQANFAQLLLALGSFAEGWPAYLNRRLPSVKNRVFGRVQHSGGEKLAARLDGQTLVLRGEQGLGDHLFFLRFAPLLRARGAKLVYQGMRQLLAMTARTGLFERVVEFNEEAGEADRIVPVGDLPYLLDLVAADVPPLALTPDPTRVEAMRARLAEAGPGPYYGITWRAGVQLFDLRWKSLYKELPATALADLARGKKATWISLQRAPAEGEVQRMASAMQAPLADFAQTNDDLEDMLALLSLLDEYIGVSNTNMHLRAGLGLPGQVFVPHPPEWRWMAEGETSPWYPGFHVYRQTPLGDWSGAVAQANSRLT